jgi:hypothetical protein
MALRISSPNQGSIAFGIEKSANALRLGANV